MTVGSVADRLGVARSTAHRVLAMLVYRDFAVQQPDRSYRAGPVLELAAHSRSHTSRLREASLEPLRHLVDLVSESANVAIRVGDKVRFIASVECEQALKVGSREGMVFAAHTTSVGRLLLAELSHEDLKVVYAPERFAGKWDDLPDLSRLRDTLARVRRAGFAVNHNLSERGVVAVGVPVRAPQGATIAAMSLSIPSSRYDPHQLPRFVSALQAAARLIEDRLVSQHAGW
jgi:DNA-binding IclR family transcriptional regulator